MFESFVDYMYYLLVVPLQKTIQSKNQFYIFLKVIGKRFDTVKQAIFKMREESIIVSASEKMLNLHALDRGMRRLKGEDVEAFRRRLMMKGIIAEKAGTKEGLILALKALGYSNVEIVPTYEFMEDTDRWAEFHIVFPEKDIDAVKVFEMTKTIVKNIKPASALPNYAFRDKALAINSIENELFTRRTYWKLDGTLKLDGTKKLDADEYPESI